MFASVDLVTFVQVDSNGGNSLNQTLIVSFAQ